MLPEVVKAVAGRCEVYLDGGVRLGTDVLKALALGAKVVFVGRPAVFSLAYNVRSVAFAHVSTLFHFTLFTLIILLSQYCVVIIKESS